MSEGRIESLHRDCGEDALFRSPLTEALADIRTKVAPPISVPVDGGRPSVLGEDAGSLVTFPGASGVTQVAVSMTHVCPCPWARHLLSPRNSQHLFIIRNGLPEGFGADAQTTAMPILTSGSSGLSWPHDRNAPKLFQIVPAADMRCRCLIRPPSCDELPGKVCVHSVTLSLQYPI